MKEDSVKRIGLVTGILFFAMMLIMPRPETLNEQAWHTLAVILLMLTWWISEAIPIPATATLPIILFPLLDIMTIKETTQSYGHPIVFLFFGGFVIALAMEKWQLHKRISIAILRKTGTHADGIIAGFMLATAFLSMWMSNTATTVMMLPIAASVLALTTSDTASKNERYFALALMLGVAYAANIGGTATLIGTPPNAVLAGFMQETFNVQIDFISWMQIGLPFALVMLIACWALLTKLIYPNRLGHLHHADDIIASEWKKLGKMTHGEISVLMVFILTAFLWMFKRTLPFSISDTGIAIAAAVTLFILPTGKSRVLVWDDMAKLPWGILLLFGGGLSIAAAMSNTGLVQMIGEHLSGLSLYGTIVLIAGVALVALLMTELMSNVALISVLLPILGGMSLELGKDPLLFAIPATLAASCAFMLPMSTPPNAIVFSSGHIRIAHMVKAGILLNIVAISLTVLFTATLVRYVFGIG